MKIKAIDKYNWPIEYKKSLLNIDKYLRYFFLSIRGEAKILICFHNCKIVSFLCKKGREGKCVFSRVNTLFKGV
jgi:hypothetical protein